MTKTMLQKTTYPARIDVSLEPCCLEALEDIREKRGVGRLLEKLLATSPLLVILGSGPIDATQSIVGTDWQMLEKSVHSVPVIVRNRCKTIAELHWLQHRKDRELAGFWKAMTETFSSHR